MANKSKTVYVCDQCGHDSMQWVGKCPACGQWNTMKEMVIKAGNDKARNSNPQQASHASRPVKLQELSAESTPRINTGNEELNRVLGGGIVPGSLILLGGEPGIGKSTLILQVVLRMQGKRILYVSGEESATQIKLRADRLQDKHIEAELFILCETHLEQIYSHIHETKPDLVIMDSIQTMQTEQIDSSPGSLSQIRECAASLLNYAKGGEISILLIGHITKEGTLAGPKVLEHIVDTVLQFEGDQQHMYRILRSTKNRFGSTHELGIFEMRHDGLREVSNPSEFLLSDHREGLSGIAIACAMEGARPLLIETQALVSSAAYGTAQRSTMGFESRRLHMLLAVLEKRVGFKLAAKDVFLNIAGGLRITDPAMDLSVIAAVLSSNGDMQIAGEICMAGEVGLSGEIRPISRIEQRISEAQRLGFQRMIIPYHNLTNIQASSFKIQLIGVRRVTEAVRVLFG